MKKYKPAFDANGEKVCVGDLVFHVEKPRSLMGSKHGVVIKIDSSGVVYVRFDMFVYSVVGQSIVVKPSCVLSRCH